MKNKIRIAAWLGGWLFCCGVLSCSRSPTLLVAVQNMPMNAQSLHVITTHAGQAAIRDLDPYALASPAPSSQTFLLQLPPNFTGDIAVGVAAYAGPDASGCLLATGTAQRDVAGGDNNLPVPLEMVNETQCSGKRPNLLSVTPRITKTSGGETLSIKGWGFKPGAAVTLGTGSVTSVKYVSPTELQVMAPARAGFGPAEVKVTNKDGSQASRGDLLRFQADPISFSAPPVSFQMSTISSVVVALFHPATTADLAVTLPLTKEVQVIFTTNGAPTPAAIKLAVGNMPSSVAAPDINNDKLPDLVVANSADNTISVLRNMGGGTFMAQVTYPTGANPASVAAADLSGDGFPDAVTANKDDDSISVLLNDKTGAFMSKVDYKMANGCQPTSVTIGDLDQDNQSDIAVSCTGSNRVVVFLNKGAGVFSTSGASMLEFTTGMSPRGLLASDINSDGKVDLMVANANSNTLLIYINLGGYKVDPVTLPTEMSPRSVAVGDVDGDGLLDLVVPCGGGSVDIFSAKLDGTFQPYRSFPVRVTTPLQAGLFDVDLDGKQDLGVVGVMNVDVLINQSK